MTREIKFRAWDEKQKYMAYQGTPDLETVSSFMHHYSDAILMINTGAKDGNGTEIYESDIICFEDGGFLEIIFQYGSFGYISNISSEFTTLADSNLSIALVIGNKFESDVDGEFKEEILDVISMSLLNTQDAGLSSTMAQARNLIGALKDAGLKIVKI